MLLTTNESNLIYLGSSQYMSKQNQLLTFVKLGDAQNFTNFDFIVDPQKINLNHPLNKEVKAIFKLSNYNNRPSLQLQDLLDVK